MDSSGQSETLFVCHECDAIQQVSSLDPGYSTYCVCCGAHLFSHPKGGIDTPLALIIAALITFIFANVYPLMTIGIADLQQTTTLIGTSLAFVDEGEPLLAFLVLCTAFIIPGLIMTGMFYVLFSLRFNLPLPFIKPILVWISRIQPWGMMDVFLLGLIVSFVKLLNDVDVVFESGFYAFVAVVILYAGVSATLEPYLLWQRLEKRK